MRIVASLFCGFGALLVGAFCGGLVAIMVLSAAGDDVSPVILFGSVLLPAILLGATGAAIGYAFSGGADEFALNRPDPGEEGNPFNHSQVNHSQSATTFLDEQHSAPPYHPASQPEMKPAFAVDDGILDAEILDAELVEDDYATPYPPPYHPTPVRPAPPMYPPRPPVHASPRRPPATWPGGWSVAGCVIGALAVMPATAAALLISSGSLAGGGVFGAIAAMLCLVGLLCMGTAMWGDFTKARVKRAGRVGVFTGLIFNSGAFLAVAFVAVSILYSDVLPEPDRVSEARYTLISAKDKRVAKAREIRARTKPVSSTTHSTAATGHGGAHRTRPRETGPVVRPRPAMVRLATAPATQAPEFTTKPNNGTRAVINGATFTTLAHNDSNIVLPPVWSLSGQQFYTAESNGTVRRIDSKDLTQTHEIKFDGKITSMCLTGKGLLLARSQPGDLILLEPTSLRPLKRYLLAGVHDAVGGPLSSSVLLVLRDRPISKPRSSFLFNLDTQEAFPQKTTVQGIWFEMTPTGDFLFTGDPRQLRRYGVGKTAFKLHQSSGSIGTNPKHVDLSADGAFVALPSGAGNRAPVGGAAPKPYTTFLFEADDISRPFASITAGGYPRTIDVDPLSGVIYVQKSGTPLMVYSQSGGMLQSYTGATLPRDSERIIASPKGGQLLMVASGKIIHALVPAVKLPGADLFDSRAKTPDAFKLTPAELPPIPRATFEGARKTVLLPAEIASVTPAGGGRYYLLHLPAAGQLAVFDVSAAKIVRYIEVGPPTASAESPGLLVAGGATHFVTIEPQASTITRWSLRTFAAEKIEPLVGAGTPFAAVMGAAGNGPVMTASNAGYEFYDVETLLPVKVKVRTSTYKLPNPSAQTHLRASGDGYVFTAGQASLRGASALAVFRVKADQIYASYNPSARTSLPALVYDGDAIFTSRGRFTLSGAPQRSGSLSFSSSGPRTVVLTPVRGELCLQVDVPTAMPGLPSRGSSADLATTLQLVARSQRRSDLTAIGQLDGGRELLHLYNKPAIQPHELGLLLDERFQIAPQAGVYFYVPLTGDRLEVRKLNVEQLLADREGDYLFFASTPPASAKAGAPFTYQLQVHSSRKPVRFGLHPRITGMDIDASGKLTWNPGATLAGRETLVTIYASNGRGTPAYQTMRIRVER